MHDNQGFTVIEMLFVLSVFSICLLCSTFYSMSERYLSSDLERIHALLLQAQQQALIHHENKIITMGRKQMWIDDIPYSYHHMECIPCSFHYSDKGTISKALSIQCRLHNKKQKLVLQLGNGACDVRK